MDFNLLKRATTHLEVVLKKQKCQKLDFASH